MARPQAGVKFKLTFPQKVLGDPVIHKISRDLDVVPNILRGRITDKGAWLEIEFQGAAKNVEKVRKYLTDQGIKIEDLA